MSEETERTNLLDRTNIQLLRRILRARYVVFTLALITSVFVYRYLVDIVDPRNNYNVFEDFSRLVKRDEYQIYSGREGGFYIRIGDALEKRTSDSGALKITNRKSPGALDNARSVASQRKAFGLVQEDTLAPGNFIRDHVRFVTPLYLERMHILYDENRFQQILSQREKSEQAGNSESEEDERFASRGRTLSVTGTVDDNDVKYFFKHAKISTGPTGSGSRLFASYLLSACGINEFTDLGLSYRDALTRMDADPELKVDLVFTIAGAPLDSVKEMLGKAGGRRYRLMSIDPSVVPIVNNQYGLKLASATFKEKYANGDSISTIGSWAFLISSRDVSDAVVQETLSLLNQVKDDIRRDMRIEADSSFQLSEFNFYSAMTNTHTGVWRLTRNLLAFAAFVCLLSTLIVTFLAWLVSGVSKVGYYRKLTSVYRSLPENTTLTDTHSNLPSPIIYRDQQPIIESLVQGQSELLRIASQIRVSYDYGELSIAHYSFLQDSLQNLRSIFQTNFVQRLNEFYANYGEYDATSLRHYYTAGYLAASGFEQLVSRYESNDPTVAGGETAEIAALTSFETYPATKVPRIFISYRRQDSNFAADRIRAQLIHRFGKDAVFQDIDIPAGKDFRFAIEREVQRCEVLLAIIGPNWLHALHDRSNEQDYVRYEIESAIDKGISIVPVLLAPASVPLEAELPDGLRQLCYHQGVIIRPDPEFKSSVARLIEELDKYFAAPPETGS